MLIMFLFQTVLLVLWCLLVFFISVLCLREFFQLGIAPLRYIFSLENYIEIGNFLSPTGADLWFRRDLPTTAFVHKSAAPLRQKTAFLWLYFEWAFIDAAAQLPCILIFQ